MEAEMSKRFIRVALVLLLLLLAALEAGRDLKHRAAEEQGEVHFADAYATGISASILESACKVLSTESLRMEALDQVCQMDYTKITYYDGSYYYQSSADYFYLYKSDVDGENKECLVQQVPEEIYVMGEWVYFTNVSAGGSVHRIRQDGSGMEEVFNRQVRRIVLMEDTFYFLSEGNVYSWTEERGAELVYEGQCEWIFTRGRLIYLDITETEGGNINSYTVVLDSRGTILATYDGRHRHKIPSGEGFYYISDDGYIMCESADTGEVTEIAKTPLSQYIPYEHWTHYEIWEDCFYLLSYQHDEENRCYHIRMYRYDFDSGNWSVIHSREVSTAYLPLYSTDAFYIINGKIYLKEYVIDGKGELWHCIDLETGEYAVFEDMGNFQVRVLNHDDLFTGATDGTQSYLAEDGVYQAEKEDDEGNLIRTDIRIPQFNDNISAYEKINQSIREDAERFYEEQMEFAEYIKDASQEWEGSSSGHWDYMYVYADSRYISIVYWKFIGQNGVTDVKCDGYEVRLYSAETGEEIEIWDLFTASETEVLLRFAFAIRKTFWGTWVLSSDVNDVSITEKPSLGWYKDYFILTDDGIDIFFVERVRTKVYHTEVGYEEWEDILIR